MSTSAVREYLFVHIDMEDDDFDLLDLAFTNAWTVMAFAERELYAAMPFPPMDQQRAGVEDWSWNLRAISEGALHKRVADTVHAVRTKHVSFGQQAILANAMPQSSGIFR